MEARDSWITDRWRKFFAIPIAIFIGFSATIAEILGLADGALVPVYILAAILGLGLTGRQYQAFVAFISVCLITPIWFRVPAGGGIPIGEVVQRLSGLICLGLLAALADRRRTEQRRDASSLVSVGGSDVDQWVRALVAPETVSDVLGVGSSSHGFQQSDLRPDTRDAQGPITSSLTRIRQSNRPGDRGDNRDDEFSFDFDDSQNDTLQIVQKLRASGSFDDEQLQLIERELSSSIRIKSNVGAGAPIANGVQIGRFIVDQPLGRGGEGNVYRGHDLNGETAAIKILHNMRVSDRFRREMHLVRQMAHPNIVTAYEVGEFCGLPFITMELLRGPDLHVLVRDSGPLTWQDSSRHLLQAARGLAHAHARDLVHRDIKPGNLILNGDGVIKLVDLGLASMGGGEAEIDSVFQLETKDGHLAGTLPYMAPEQARSLTDATVQSDIYGLGATWFYLLTGRERLRGKTFSKQFENLLLKRRFNALPDQALPGPLKEVYRRMVAYDVCDRYTDCDQLVTDLETALVAAGESVAAVEGINVLVVEDSRTDMVLTIEMLRRSNPALSIHEARTLSDGLGVCRSMHIDLVLLDLSLPDSSGVETVTRFRSAMHSVPLVVLTGMSQDEVGSKCLAAGANTFISKSGLTPHRMERTIFVTLSRCGVPKKVI